MFSKKLVNWIQSIGPAIIVASVVLGPGSILISSKVGCQYGYSMLWVLLTAAVLMFGMTALAARLGIGTEKTLCSELSDRLGRPFAALVGILLFLIVACFQTSNNMAVLTSVESLLSSPEAEGSQTPNKMILAGILVAFNIFIIVMMFGMRNLYKPLEGLMKLLLLLMLIGFGANLLMAGPSIGDIFAGLFPSLEPDLEGGVWPLRSESGEIVDPLWAVQGMIATTFSVAGAFYQGYLVREKGWTHSHLRQGLFDSLVGISVLAGCSAMIMITSAVVLHGKILPDQLQNAADVAGQLEPLFGSTATVLFSCGIFAACFSPFLINAMIGGLLLSDGLGLGSTMDALWPRRLTVAALLFGMGMAIWATFAGENPVGVIIFAQALTVLGVPLLALSLLYLATRPDVRERVPLPTWMFALCGLGCVATVAMAIRTAWRIWLQVVE